MSVMASASRRVLLVTGGSRGIGAATVRLAAERGYDVCINYRANAEAAAHAVEDARRAGARALAVQADIALEADVVRLFATCDAEIGRVSALVNNAAILETQTRLDNIDAARLARVFGTNVFGAFLCAREAVRRMSTRHGGTGGAIVNVSSGASRMGSPGEYIDYAATKGALDTMTLGLAREVAAEGIRVNAVLAGHIYTELHASGGEPNRVERVKSQVPMGRGGRPEEVAQAILWLLSDDASYTTGALVDVAGGK
jgi:NAD(P)-dependent dehydrogenase (short-subunit alcohol dehydrogenase family)